MVLSTTSASGSSPSASSSSSSLGAPKGFAGLLVVPMMPDAPFEPQFVRGALLAMPPKPLLRPPNADVLAKPGDPPNAEVVLVSPNGDFAPLKEANDGATAGLVSAVGFSSSFFVLAGGTAPNGDAEVEAKEANPEDAKALDEVCGC